MDNSQGINIVSKMIKKYFEYQDADIVVLDDRDPARTQPTVANVTTAFENLLKETRAGDVRLFYFDGHGGTIKDVNGDEPDKKDETLGCSDGELVDDDLADAISEVMSFDLAPISIADAHDTVLPPKMQPHYARHDLPWWHVV